MKHEKKESLYFNSEMSWLAFNERVYAASQNALYPILERTRFLGIAANNLDEFYMVRLGRLYKTHQLKQNRKSVDGLAMDQLMPIVKNRAMEQIAHHVQQWRSLRKELGTHSVNIISPKELSEEDKKWLEDYFIKNIFPVLTPMAIDPAHPVPQIPSRGISMVVQLQDKDQMSPVYAFIPLPMGLDRFIQLHGEEDRYIFIEQVITLFLHKLFSNHIILAQGLFRLIRNAEMSLQYSTSDFRMDFEEALAQRLNGEVVQLAVNARMPEHLRLYVTEQFDVNPNDMLVIDGVLGINDVQQLVSICGKKELLFPDFIPRTPQRIRNNNDDIFEAVKIKDIVVHHPYESFEVILMFLKQAAKDKNVISIKQTLYRTGDNSPVVAALIDAAKAGKSVTALVEIRARFDEEANIKWTKDLEQAGVHVIYGIVGLKTHAKLCLIVRKEAGGLKTYTHFGTGNYNAKTARVYTDLSLLTADPKLCYEAACIFNYMTGYSRIDKFDDVGVAPFTLRANLLELIENEIKFAKNGMPAVVWAKMNSLTDPTLIDALYKASNAGVKIFLIVRGMCCLRPGIPKFSENISVKSIVGRFLEHARIFCFGNGDLLPSTTAKVFISSADWMPRNLDTRLELMVNISNQTVHQQILQQIMFANLNDTANSWKLMPDGTYTPLFRELDDFDAHQFFIHNTSLSGSGMGPYPVTPNLISFERES
ncbi:RNA degradosome polyphosphate kinase [Candidatus Paracaedibacter symbiosus]|uniref:RNA degradosome polyphosphate kinase n=1 Tax=Candidatus Paracaedibacter symbiosus TaxID=244582 RepID=UPI0018DD6BBF|nr:RNA degradosome polyphosphate kinase [Candidatus Paracaedibacter symbiosus]